MTATDPHRGADETLRKKAASIVGAARGLNLTLITVESCTAGRVAATLADAPNASDAVHGGFITYTEACKEALGVPADMLKRYGPVSEDVARAMATAALERSPADISIAVTGVVGPTTDDDGDPVGLIFLAASRRDFPTEVVKKEFGTLDRDAILFNTVEQALDLLGRMIRPAQAQTK
jgi:nicotinamide-nucleotide amidase